MHNCVLIEFKTNFNKIFMKHYYVYFGNYVKYHIEYERIGAYIIILFIISHLNYSSSLEMFPVSYRL